MAPSNSRPGVSHVTSSAGDAYEEKLRNKMNGGVAVGGGTNISSSRPGVQYVSKGASDGFEARLRRKSQKEDERISNNNKPMPKRGSLTTSCQTTSEVQRHTQQRRASVSSANSDDYEKKVQAKMAAQEQQKSAAKALRNEMNRETKKINRRSSMPIQSISTISAVESAADHAPRSRRPSRRDELNTKLNEHKSSLSSMQSKNNEDEELCATRSKRRPSRRDALDAKVNEVRSSLKESTTSQTSIISDKYDDNGMVTRRSLLEAKLAAKRRSSAMSIGSVGSEACARSGGGGVSCGESAGSKSTLDEKLARKRLSISMGGTNGQSSGIVDLSVSAAGEKKKKKSKKRSSKGGGKRNEAKGKSSATLSGEKPDQSRQGSQHEESWDALDDVLRQAQILSMSEK